jgi:hypothetical protein
MPAIADRVPSCLRAIGLALLLSIASIARARNALTFALTVGCKAKR